MEESMAMASAVVTAENYSFPTGKLKSRMMQAGKKPLVLVACGSFSPPTLLHLRLFSLGGDHARVETDFEIVGGYLSPVSDAYKKMGLAPAEHRIRMCELAVGSSKWVDVDPWEAVQPDYVLTAKVLDHFDHEINEVLGGVEDVDGNKVRVQIALLAGADLIETWVSPHPAQDPVLSFTDTSVQLLAAWTMDSRGSRSHPRSLWAVRRREEGNRHRGGA
jgi:nicotinamide mononucleotide adenylyltransferase